MYPKQAAPMWGQAFSLPPAFGRRSSRLWRDAGPKPRGRLKGGTHTAKGQGRPSRYLTGKLTVDPLAVAGDVWPPTEIVIGCGPGLRPDGTWMSIWYSPTKPGARNAFPPANTVACLPPMVTVTGLVVSESGGADAASPLDCGLVTGPRPLA